MTVYGTPSVAFLGHAGAGKSTAAQFLANTYGHTLLSFAAPLKRIATELWVHPGREEHQRLGAAVREINESTWVDLLADEIHRHDEAVGLEGKWPAYAVDDCRFSNEAAMLEGEDFVLVRLKTSREQQVARLTANGKWQNEDQLNHLSETALDHYPVDYEFENTGDVVDLYEFLSKIISREMRA